MKIVLTLLLISVSITVVMGFELLNVGDSPTAGILQQNEIEINTKIYRENGILVGSSVGLFQRFMFGISYGGEKIVGNQVPKWNERIEVGLKYRILDESPKLPALAVGFDTQGHGGFNSELKRYDIKSKGFYTVLSRNYLFLGNTGFHFGMNYSLENKDNQNSMNFFAGIDKALGDHLTLMIDYDTALNDRTAEVDNTMSDAWEALKKEFNRKGNGYLNLSLLLNLTETLKIKVIAYDLLENNKLTQHGDRAIIINYNMNF